MKNLISILVTLLFCAQCGAFKRTPPLEIKNLHSYNLSGPIVLFGDSLAYGAGSSSPDKALMGCFDRHFDKKVINKAVNGAKTTDALRKVSEVVGLKPSLVFVSLGGNDVLAHAFNRSVPEHVTLENLRQVFKSFSDSNSLVFFLGLKPPQKFYAGRIADIKRFEKMNEIAKEEGVLLIEDGFEGLWKKPQFMSDHIHPNDQGYEVICKRIIKVLGASDFS